MAELQPDYLANAQDFYGNLLGGLSTGPTDFKTRLMRSLGIDQLRGVVSTPGLNAAGQAYQQNSGLVPSINPLAAAPAIYSAIKAYNAPPTAAPAAGPVAAPQMGPMTAPPGVPQVGTRTAMVPGAGGGGQQFDLGTMPQLPAAPKFPMPQTPQLGPAPQVNAPQINASIPGYDFTEYKKLLDKAGVGGSENAANVLGGLARGAASVNATEPGSFAKALAASGSGASEGYSKSLALGREDAQRRAAAELQMQSLQHGAAKDQADLAYKSAELNYHASVQNALLSQNRELKQAELGQQTELKKAELGTREAETGYQAGLKTTEMQMPRVQHDANGVTIQQVDPATNKITATYHNTKTFLDHAEKMKDVIQAVTGNSPVAEATEANMLINSYKGQPQLAQAALTQLAVRRTIANGAGQAVFGTAYELAAKAAKKQLDLENPGLQAKPDEYQKELNNRVVSTLLNDPKINQYGWLHDAANHSVAARILSGAMSGGQPQQ